MSSKLWGFLGAGISFIIALFAAMTVGKHKERADQAEDDLVAKDKAIKEDQEGQRLENEANEKDNTDIRSDTYFK